MHIRVPLIVVLALVLASPASAWHDQGHMAVARIAWLSLDKNQKDQVTKILKGHVQFGIDHYDVFLSADCPADAKVDEWAFMRAATWSDWVRDPKSPKLKPGEADDIRMKFSKGDWHFVNLPFVLPAEVALFDVDALRKDALLPELDPKTGEPRHALAALKQSMDTLQNPNAPMPKKAVALCWLLHLVGDLHQPLHASALFAKKQFAPVKFNPPHGDQGGNLFAIKLTKDDPKATRLHFYWDGLLFNDDETDPTNKYQAVTKKAADLRDKFKETDLPELAKKTFLDWADESLELAKTDVYQKNGKEGGGFLPATPLKGKVKLDGLDAPVLSGKYQDNAAAVAERRITLAGYRLAAQVKKALEPAE